MNRQHYEKRKCFFLQENRSLTKSKGILKSKKLNNIIFYLAIELFILGHEVSPLLLQHGNLDK
jgi:hypothetical protein